MRFWWLAMKDAKIIALDRKALLTLVFMPILLIGILGAAFGNLLGKESTGIDRFTAAIVNLDEGELGSFLEQEVLKKDLSEWLKVKSMNREQMEEQLKAQEAEVGLVLPPDFTDSIISGSSLEVEITSIPSAAIQSTIIENIIMEFSQSAAVNAAAMKVAAETAADRKPMEAASPVFLPETFTAVKEITLQEEKEPVGSFQYYAAGMGVMFLMMTVVTGASAMIEEKEQDVYNRLLVSNLTSRDYLLGKFMGLLFISFIQFFIIIIGTRILFKVDWGDSPLGLATIGIAYVFSLSGIGVFLGTLMDTEKTFSAAGMLGTQLLAAAGGSMVPLYVFPDWVNGAVKIFPNALTLQTFLDLMSGASFSGIVNEAMTLFAIGLLFLWASWLAFSAKRRSWHA